jgi:hypothetical protein
MVYSLRARRRKSETRVETTIGLFTPADDDAVSSFCWAVAAGTAGDLDGLATGVGAFDGVDVGDIVGAWLKGHIAASDNSHRGKFSSEASSRELKRALNSHVRSAWSDST